jgi:hypothetical protein
MSWICVQREILAGFIRIHDIVDNLISRNIKRLPVQEQKRPVVVRTPKRAPNAVRAVARQLSGAAQQLYRTTYFRTSYGFSIKSGLFFASALSSLICAPRGEKSTCGIVKGWAVRVRAPICDGNTASRLLSCMVPNQLVGSRAVGRSGLYFVVQYYDFCVAGSGLLLAQHLCDFGVVFFADHFVVTEVCVG